MPWDPRYTGKYNRHPLHATTLQIALALWEGGQWTTEALMERAQCKRNTVYASISHLRRRFGYELIETTWGKGYRLRGQE